MPISAAELLDRLPGHTGPLSPAIETDGTWFEPPTEENLLKLAGKAVYIAVKDGRVFGGRDFDLNTKLLDSEGTALICRSNHLGGGWAKIPVDEILGIKSAW